MKELTKPVKIWLSAFAGVSLLALILVLVGMHSRPVVSVNQAQVRSAAEETLECVRSGDYEALSLCLSGAPQLGKTPEKDGTAASQIWYAYLDSITCELGERCYGLDSGVGLDAVVRCLDVSAVTDAMEKSAPELLAKKAENAKSEKEIYDENHNYLESVVEEVMAQAAKAALQEQLPRKELALTLQLERQNGQWKVILTPELQALLSGALEQ